MLSFDRKFSWLGLALEARILTDPIIDLVENRIEDKEGQLLLFPIDMKTRERFAELASTLDGCLKKNVGRKGDWRNVRYEMFDFVQRCHTDDEWEPIIEQMYRVSCGEKLEEYHTLIAALGDIESRALHLTRHSGGGCF
jgi:hypothetical protein